MASTSPSQADFSSCSDLASALNYIVQQFSAASGTIHLLDSDGLLHLAASQGIPESALEKLRTVPVGRDMAGLAVERRQPVSGSSLPAETYGDVRAGSKAGGTTGTQAAISLPIFHGDAVVGSLGVSARDERSFTEPEVGQLMEMGRILAAKYIDSMRISAA